MPELSDAELAKGGAVVAAMSPGPYRTAIWEDHNPDALNGQTRHLYVDRPGDRKTDGRHVAAWMFPGDAAGFVWLRDNAAALIAAAKENAALRTRIAGYRVRLELDHVFVLGENGDAIRQEVPEDRIIPDGIEARDATIALQDEEIERLRRDAVQPALLNGLRRAISALNAVPGFALPEGGTSHKLLSELDQLVGELATQPYENDPNLALWFTPQCIRDHFDDDTVDEMTEEELAGVGKACLQSEDLYRTFHRVLKEEIFNATGAEVD